MFPHESEIPIKDGIIATAELMPHVSREIQLTSFIFRSFDDCRGTFWKSALAAELQELESMAAVSSFAQGSILYEEGQVPRYVFILMEGDARIATGRSGDRHITFRIAKPGAILGLEAAMTGNLYKSRAEVIHTCKVASIPCHRFSDFLSRHPGAAQGAAREVGQSFIRAIARLRTIGAAPSSTARVARLLLEWSMEGTPTVRGIELRVALKHSEIGECVGLARETITRVLLNFRHSKIIETRGSAWTITDIKRMEQCAKWT